MSLKKMKYILLIWLTVAGILSCPECKSQVNDSIVPKIDNPRKVLRKIDIRNISQRGFNFWNDRFSGHWAGLHFGFNGFCHTDYSGYTSDFIKNDVFRSNSAFVNPLQQSIALQRNKNTVGLVTGLGLQFQSYRLDKNTTIREGSSGRVEPYPLTYFDNNQKSKLSIVYITLPLLAELQIPVKNYQNRVYFSSGLYTGMRINSHTKIKYREDGKKEKLKTPADFYLNKFKYGIMVRTGYRQANFFATYDLSPLFEKSKGPGLTPFTIGVTLISF
jgi:hypothetical protein